MGGTAPYAINDLDQIVGDYTDAQGDLHAFFATPNLGLFAFATAAPLADPVPEPSTWAMMLMGLAGLGLVGLRSRPSKRRVHASPMSSALGGSVAKTIAEDGRTANTFRDELFK
jgi:PEP-CTERM motif